MKPSQFRLLGPVEKEWLAIFIHRLVPTAADTHHSMSRVAAKQISLTMWRWTADGINSDGHVVPDSIKYDTQLLPATVAAHEAAIRGDLKSLRHEHVVPRGVLAQYLIESRFEPAAIAGVLEKYCLGVIVTIDEDRLLSRSAMPADWKWDAGDAFARYHDAGLHKLVRHPARGEAAV